MAGLIQHNGGGDFASLNAAVAEGAGAITISGDWAGDDTTDVTWDSACTVRISGDSLNKVGKPGRAAGSYRLVKPNAGADHVFTVSADVDIWDMDIMSDSEGASDEIFRVGTNEVDITCKRCHIGFSGNVNHQDVVYYEGDNDTVEFTFESCMFYDIGRSIIDCYIATGNTITVNFNSCSSFNIGIDGAREDGCWYGAYNSGAASTVTVNAFNCLIEYDTLSEVAFASNANDGGTLNVDYCISKGDNGTGDAAGDLAGNWDTVNQGNGNEYSKTWVEGDPGAGQVGLIDITGSPYDQRLFDDAAQNLAQDNHSVETGPDSGLSIPNDIVGTVRGASEDHDVGAFEIAAAGTNVSAGLDTLVITEYAATVNAEVSFTAGLDTLVITEYAADVNLNVSVGATLDALVITEYSADVSLGIGITAGLDTLVITEYPATVNAEVSFTAGLDALVITEYAAVVSLGINVVAGLDTLIITEFNPTVNAAIDFTAGLDTLIITEYNATVTLAEALALTRRGSSGLGFSFRQGWR